jgi:hypothetical protein
MQMNAADRGASISCFVDTPSLTMLSVIDLCFEYFSDSDALAQAMRDEVVQVSQRCAAKSGSVVAVAHIVF